MPRTRKQISEGALETLRPGAGSSGAGDSMTSVLGEVLAQIRAMSVDMSTDDLSKLRESLAQIGQEAGQVPDDGRQNLASIQPRGIAADALKEDLKVLFNSDELNLSEAFKTKAIALFEAAVDVRLQIETVRIEEEAAEAIAESISEYEDSLAENVDKYLSYASKQFVADNQLVIEQEIATDHLTSLVAGIYEVFKEHNIAVPESDVDAVEELQNEVERLQEQNDELTRNLIENEERLLEIEKERVLEEAVSNMNDLDAERLVNLTESILIDDIEEFAARVSVLKESFTSFGGRKTGRLLNEDIETFDENSVFSDDVSTNKTVDPNNPGSVYASLISKLPKS